MTLSKLSIPVTGVVGKRLALKVAPKDNWTTVRTVRWSYGDCKIWHDDNGPPWGTDWVVLADGLRTYDGAWRALVRLQGRRMCT